MLGFGGSVAARFVSLSQAVWLRLRGADGGDVAAQLRARPSELRPLARGSSGRLLVLERLEVRRLLTAEGDLLNISRSFETTGLLGELSASVRWGDGSVTAGSVAGGTGTGNVRVRFDYSLDTAGFFTPPRRALLNTAVDVVLSQITDQLAAINPSGANTWTALPLHPETGRSVSIVNPQIAANEILVFVGSQNLGTDDLAIGGPGGFQVFGTADWIRTVQARGQSGALATKPTDFGPWGGSLSFNNRTNWYFGSDPSQIGANQFDFVSVATHEFMHLLGFGVAPSWSALVSGDRFTGPKATAAYDLAGSPPLGPGRDHWAASVTDQGRPTLMDLTVLVGSRTLLTPLDMAALDDIGWDVTNRSAVVTAGHIYPDNGTYPVEVTLRGSRLGRLTQTLSVSVTNAAPTLTLVANQAVTTGVRFNLPNLGQITDRGFANPLASPPTTETFTYTINWGDGSTPVSGAARIDRVGSAGTVTLASLDGAHTYAAAGTYTVTVTVADDDRGVASGTFRITATDPPRLVLSLNRTSIREDAGAGAATLTVSRPASSAASAVTVQLSSSDTSEATLPPSVTIAAGQLSAQVAVNAVDDNLLDGSQGVTLRAAAVGFEPASIEMVVTDAETITATFSAAVIGEDAPAGSVSLTIRRSNTDTQSPLSVTVSGNDDRRITLPRTIVIPAGSAQVVVPLQPIDDAIAQRPQLLQYSFTAAGYSGAQQTITLVDDEPPLFQNPVDRFDVDGDGQLQPLDALRILTFLAGVGGSAALDPNTDSTGGLFVDVNGDYQVTPLDALLVLIEFGRRQRLAIAAQAEQFVMASAPVTKQVAQCFVEIAAAPHVPEFRPLVKPPASEADHQLDHPWLPALSQRRSS